LDVDLAAGAVFRTLGKLNIERIMKIIRYEDSAGKIHLGAEQPGRGYARLEGDLFGGVKLTGEIAVVRKILAPVVPTMIWCIGQNYRRHVDEVGADLPKFPVLFAKGPNCVQNPDDPILVPARAKTSELDYEGELVAIIGKVCKDASRERALEYVAGYTCGNDVSARDWQLKMGGSQWCRGKSFDTFAPMGPCLVTPETLPNPRDLHIQTVVNGRTMQDGNTRDMIHDVAAIIEFLSQSTTLLPGTAIFTGTPHGVGMAQDPPLWLRVGDTVNITVEKIGTLTNSVSVG
jgi:2-keto-4-pentenoate hydratase/2-oxohepta-3-ene-1,7-dioic acid hydratase in catechol pathway